jgi:hypothetical protein
VTIRITQEEWLKELQRVQASDPEGLTTVEWAKRLGLNERSTRTLLKQGIAAGLIQFNGHRRDYRMDGLPCHTPVYQVIEKVERANSQRGG